MGTEIRYVAFLVGMIMARGSMGQSILPDDYAYDGNGNLVRDMNKDIVDIHYNIRNLPDTITYADGQKIVYVYTAMGQKICQQVSSASGESTVRRDYVGDLLYENGELQQLQHAEGRVVLGSNNPEYQYHLKDHLGDVRTTVTSAPDVNEYLATMESEKAEQEALYFSDLVKRSPYIPANHTVGGNEVLGLAPGVARAAGFNLAVNKGDVVYLEVYAYYENGVLSDDDPQSPSFASAVTSIASSVSAVGGRLLSAEAGALSSPGSPAAMLLPGADADKLPSAYLNYALFDKHYVMLTGGYRKVTKQGAYAKELLTLGPLEIKQSGYLDVYLSNTGPNTRVYFDDLKVKHVEGPIVQEDSYDPFGLALSGQHGARYGEPQNRYLYNGKELQQDHDLNWYDYGARMYDPALGRWHVQDPLAEKYASWSPYQYTLNNPVKFVDPDGRDVIHHENMELTSRQEAVGKSALEHASAIPTGNLILNNADRNPNVTVHVMFVDDLGYDDKGEVRGLALKLQSGDTQNSGNKTVVNMGKDSEFHVFDGLDVASDIHTERETYFILVEASGDPYTVAETLLHEVEAHVNGNGKPPADPAAYYENAEAEEHAYYGSSAPVEYGWGVAPRTRKPIVKRISPAVPPGSTADQVQQELAKRKQEEHNKRRRK